jgi:hypothetical protein
MTTFQRHFYFQEEM